MIRFAAYSGLKHVPSSLYLCIHRLRGGLADVEASRHFFFSLSATISVLTLRWTQDVGKTVVQGITPVAPPPPQKKLYFSYVFWTMRVVVSTFTWKVTWRHEIAWQERFRTLLQIFIFDLVFCALICKLLDTTFPSTKHTHVL